MKTLPVTQIISRNCGGYGAWMDNPLSSPAPGSDLWAGFQIGGSKRRRSTRRITRCIHRCKSHKSHKQHKQHKR